MIQADRVAQGNQVSGSLRPADSGELGGHQDVPLWVPLLGYGVERLAGHGDTALRRRGADRLALGADIHHAGLSTLVDMR